MASLPKYGNISQKNKDQEFEFQSIKRKALWWFKKIDLLKLKWNIYRKCSTHNLKCTSVFVATLLRHILHMWLDALVFSFSAKFSSKIKYVNSLQELGRIIPMEYVNIPASIIRSVSLCYKDNETCMLGKQTVVRFFLYRSKGVTSEQHQSLFEKQVWMELPSKSLPLWFKA